MSPLHFPGLGAPVVDPPNDQVYDCDYDEGAYKASHDADLMSSPRAGVERARGFITGHCGYLRRMEVRTGAVQYGLKGAVGERVVQRRLPQNRRKWWY